MTMEDEHSMILVERHCKECGTMVLCMAGNEDPKSCKEHTPGKRLTDEIKKK